MYELLLQADKALADGLLVQAEQTYWQLIELDPSNAIALAGLAQVSLERGDEGLARRFADRAMTIDPENVAARRVVDALEHRGAEDEAKVPDLPLAAARRLEALSKRRTALPEPAESAGTSADPAADRSKTKHRNRRKAGREDAAPQPAHRDATRHEPHHAMPSGKRRFGANELRTPTTDAYAAAEAVDALDMVEEPPMEVPGPISGEVDDPETVEAAEAAESVAVRPALVVDGTDLDAAWLQEAEEIEAKGIEAEKLESEAAPADESVAVRVELVADASEREAAELEAAWARDAEARWMLHVAAANSVVERDESVETSVAEPQAEEPATREPARIGSIDEEPQVAGPRADDFEAAEAEAARLAPRELLEAQSLEPGDLVERVALPRQSLVEDAEELSEKEAETQALREALAIVLGNESQAGPVQPSSTPDAAPSSATPAAPPAATPGQRSDEPPAQGELAGPAEADAPAKRTPETEPEPASRRRKGLFRRFGGS